MLCSKFPSLHTVFLAFTFIPTSSAQHYGVPNTKSSNLPIALAELRIVEDTASAPSNRSRSSSVCSVTSAVLSPSRALTSMSSTSSLGSVIPTSERFSKLLAEEIISTEIGNVALSTRTPPSPSPFLFGNKSSSTTECNVVESIDDDMTPRATEFAISSHRHSDSTSVQVKTRRRPSALALVLPQEIVSVCLQLAIGVSPYVPSDTEVSVSVCSLPSPTTFIPTSCQPSSYVPLVSSSAVASSTSSTKSITSTTSSFPFSRARAGSRVMLTSPLPGPPPSSPLPPLPNLTAQNLDVITSQNAPVSLPPISRTPSKRTHAPVRTDSPLSTVAAPPSPGSLRLPSCLSWGATGRMLVSLPSSLPSPPSSPSKIPRFETWCASGRVWPGISLKSSALVEFDFIWFSGVVACCITHTGITCLDVAECTMQAFTSGLPSLIREEHDLQPARIKRLFGKQEIEALEHTRMEFGDLGSGLGISNDTSSNKTSTQLQCPPTPSTRAQCTPLTAGVDSKQWR
ncbi:hypothetical protein EDD22DRAFT_964443 [Suillus occidentalis]|nr:hypothetical protein EDD22DRAFT_964443 [Suillus occidentalis]